MFFCYCPNHKVNFVVKFQTTFKSCQWIPDWWSLTFWSQCTNFRHNTISNIHNTWFLKHLCRFVAFWLKSFQHGMHKLTGSSALGLEAVDLIYWQSVMLDDSSQTGRTAGRQAGCATVSQALRSFHPKASSVTPQRAPAPLLSLRSSPIDLQRGPPARDQSQLRTGNDPADRRWRSWIGWALADAWTHWKQSGPTGGIWDGSFIRRRIHVVWTHGAALAKPSGRVHQVGGAVVCAFSSSVVKLVRHFWL